MIYLKLENEMDNFLRDKKLPRSLKKIVFKSKCRNGKFLIRKSGIYECIIIPEINEKILKKLKILSEIRCWKNICISEDLRNNEKFLDFAKSGSLKIMDGRWLFKNLADKVMEYIFDYRNQKIENQEISILCNKIDEVIVEKIKEISSMVKVCNILTNNIKQYKKLEENLYKTNGIILNISNNYKKVLLKSSLILNFDFLSNDLEKCVYAKDSYIVNFEKNMDISKKYWDGKNISFYEIQMPKKFCEQKKFFEGFNDSILYESFIYKKTSYRNIKKEVIDDDIKINYLIDSNGNNVKKPDLNLEKTLDKITI